MPLLFPLSAGDTRRSKTLCCAQLPRFHRHAQRLANALANVQAGQPSYISSPILESYHTIWFELYEELITAAGRIREQEAAAGRAT